MESYYDLLNIKSDADKKDIKRAFYKLAKKFHPDIAKNPNRFVDMLIAYKTLIDDDQRERYNSISLGKTHKERIIIPKNRVSFALSLADIARLRIYNPNRGKRRSSIHFNPKGYDVCVYMTRSELLSCCYVEIDVPAHVVCPLCRGNRVCCRFCADRGYILRAVPVPVEIPGGLGDGDIFTLRLRQIRLKDYAFFMLKNLNVKIKVLKE